MYYSRCKFNDQGSLERDFAYINKIKVFIYFIKEETSVYAQISMYEA